MQDVFHEAVNLLEKDERLVMATVVRTKGSTPQKPGAKLLVRADGTGVGTLGGGLRRGRHLVRRHAANEARRRRPVPRVRAQRRPRRRGRPSMRRHHVLPNRPCVPTRPVHRPRQGDRRRLRRRTVRRASQHDQVARRPATRRRRQAAGPRGWLDRGDSRIAPTRPRRREARPQPHGNGPERVRHNRTTASSTSSRRTPLRPSS